MKNDEYAEYKNMEYKRKSEEENLKKIKEEYKAEIKKITDAQDAYAEWLEQHQQVQIEQVKQNVTYYQFFMRWLTGDSSWEPYKDEYTEALNDYIPELGQDNDPHIKMWDNLKKALDWKQNWIEEKQKQQERKDADFQKREDALAVQQQNLYDDTTAFEFEKQNYGAQVRKEAEKLNEMSAIAEEPVSERQGLDIPNGWLV